jgi:diphosphomevalonate decarboxylase
LVVQTAKGPKPIGSRDGMERSRRTSPYYGPWVHASLSDLDAAEDALARRDLGRLGPIVEHSCFKMHACMLATMPPILYWTPATVAAIHAVWEARGRGLPGYVTIDAGPHVKVLCSAEHAEPLAEHLRGVAGVREVTVCRPGPDARATPQPLAEAAVPDQGLASP